MPLMSEALIASDFRTVVQNEEADIRSSEAIRGNILVSDCEGSHWTQHYCKSSGSQTKKRRELRPQRHPPKIQTILKSCDKPRKG